MTRGSFGKAILCWGLFAAAGIADPLVWRPTHQIRIVLDNPIDHPFYWWPQTLLSYPVQFNQTTDLTRLRLQTGSGEPVPLQWSNVVREGSGVVSATLNFISDLPVGSRREFILKSGEPESGAAKTVTEVKEGETIVLDSGALRVRIPVSQYIHGPAPGPVLQLSRGGGKWFGTSTFAIADDAVRRIRAERVDAGPLFITYRLTYEMAKGDRYVAAIKCVKGLDFVQIREDMENLQEGATGSWKMVWDGLPVSYRQSSNHPFPFPTHIEDYDAYHWEPVDQLQTNTHLGVTPGMKTDGELPFAIGAYEPWWAFSTSSFANFWDAHLADAVGIFVDKVGEWQDHDYAIWHASPKLQIRPYYNSKTLSFRYPVGRGARSTCLTLYDHAKDVETMHQLEGAVRRPPWHDGLKYGVRLSPTSYALFLQNRYGTIDLNVVKDWILENPKQQNVPKIFSTGETTSAADLERRVMSSDFLANLPLTGTRQNGGFGPTSSRQIEDFWIDGFNRFAGQMTESQRKRLTAAYLFMAYVHAGEDYMPMVPMLSGHPNFLSDVKSVPAAMAFLFPWHPEAATWADEYQKFVELNTRYHTRPSVPAWGAHGGRWTENLGTYVWAFLRPSLRADFLLKQYDGAERFVTPQIAELGEWLVNSLSAPFKGESKETVETPGFSRDMHEWGVVMPGAEPRRVYPPMGAHSERRIPPRALWYLGLAMRQYAPLTAEYLMWAARPTDQDVETPKTRPDPWTVMYNEPDNRGTDPHLLSSKYTGFGITLRSAVGTPNELSVHLQQIDDGPNYRWGNAAEGGNGVLYFFAGGKSYSYNGREDVGDRTDQDTDFCTNFGVWKDGYFHSVGRNVLARPLYDLDVAQYAELVPRSGAHAYSAPEYVGRSVLLAGQDYFVLYDDVFNESVGHRLSWFVRKGEELPFIKLVKGGSGESQIQRTEVRTGETEGVWFDGAGDSMAVVSNRKDLTVTGAAFGAEVHGPGVDDLVFRSPDGVHHAEGGVTFDGKAGLVRRRREGVQFASFHGSAIGVPGLALATDDPDFGISGTIATGGSPTGQYFAPRASRLRFRLTSLPQDAGLYIDGERQPVQKELDWTSAEMKAGTHHWEITNRKPVPMAPEIARTENYSGGAKVVSKVVTSAEKYRFELSKDNGQTWATAGEGAAPEITLHGLKNGSKVHVRGLAINSDHASAPGPEYPIYVSGEVPDSPSGLRLVLSEGASSLSWGEVLGISEYRLYERKGTNGPFTLVYHGAARTYADKRKEIQAADAVPGESHSGDVFEYRVASINGNGEGRPSRIVDTNPGSWTNWDPMPGEPFRRDNVRSSRTASGVYYPTN